MGVNPADDKELSTTASEQGTAQAAPQLTSRRRMLRRSLGVAAPAVLTLASNPVSACNCIQASTFVSQVALSSRTPTNAGCTGGKTPGGWAGTPVTSWPSGCKSGTYTTKTLSSVFGSDCNWAYWNCGLSGSTTLMQALTCSNPVACDIVAAYVSASAGDFVTTFNNVTILSTGEVYKMWRALSSTGNRYTPTGTSFSWTASQAQSWIVYMR